MGGALASILKNLKKKNPKTDGPLMDYNLIMITLPMAVAGSIIGVLISKIYLDDEQSFYIRICNHDSFYDPSWIFEFRYL